MVLFEIREASLSAVYVFIPTDSYLLAGARRLQRRINTVDLKKHCYFDFRTPPPEFFPEMCCGKLPRGADVSQVYEI